MAGFAAVEAKDELIEIGLQMLATQPVVDASRPSFKVGEDLVDPRQDEVSGGLPDDMDIVAMAGTAKHTAFGFRGGVPPADLGVRRLWDDPARQQWFWAAYLMATHSNAPLPSGWEDQSLVSES